MHGRDRQHRPQPDDEVSDQFGFVSEDGVFCDAGATRAVLTANVGGLGDMRSIAPISLIWAGRSLAAFGGFGCARCLLTVSLVCERGMSEVARSGD